MKITPLETNRKYRILLILRWPVGGIRTFIRYVYNNFDSSRYHITLVAPDIPELKVMMNDLKGFDVSYETFANSSSSWSIAAMVMKTIMFGRFNLIHSHGFTAGLYSVLPARIKRVKHIMTSHDILSEKQFKGVHGFFKHKVLSLLLPWIDVIHSVGNDAHNNLLDFIPVLKKRSNCLVIPNGIEVERFKGSEKRDLRMELNLPEDAFLIGFMGRFMSQKGFIYLVEAIEQLLRSPSLPKRPVVLTFGSGGFIREDKSYIQKKGLAKHILFLPFTADISATLKGLDVVAMPSLWEACPLLPMEAMVTGLPIIGTDCIGLREVIRGTPNVMVPPGDSNALANALANEIKNPSRKRAEEFRKEAMSRFDVRKQAAELEATILNLIEP